MRQIRRHLTYANVMSTLAVFAVLAGGGAWAASKISTNDIQNGAVTAKKLHASAVTKSKIEDGAVTAAKLRALVGARAYAEVTPGGGVRRAFGMTAADVTHPHPVCCPQGVYCIKVNAPNAQVTTGLSPTGGVQTNATLLSAQQLKDQGRSVSDFGCSKGTHWVVNTTPEAEGAQGYGYDAYFEIVLF